jgi:hypothetical protein
MTFTGSNMLCRIRIGTTPTAPAYAMNARLLRIAVQQWADEASPE